MRQIVVCFFVLAAACSSGDNTASSGSGTTTNDGESVASTGGPPTDAISTGAVIVGRTNVQSSGNRYLSGSLDLTVAPEIVELPDAAMWLIPIDDGSLAAVMSDGSASHLGPDGELTALADVDPLVRPLALLDGGSIVLVPANSGVASDLPDATEVSDDDVRACTDHDE